MKCRAVEGNLIIENQYYYIVLNRSRGGSITDYRPKNAWNKHVYREGCELYSPTWGSFRDVHYQQEYGGVAEFKVEASPSLVKVNVESRMGTPKLPRKIYGWCKNQWIFKENTPLILCDFIITHNQTLPDSFFKKYICAKPSAYSHWAYKRDGETVSNPIDARRIHQAHGYPAPEWITLFSQTEGLALILPDRELWRGDTWPKSSCFSIARTKSMAELNYYSYFSREKVQLTLCYLGYLTTPEEKYHALERYL